MKSDADESAGVPEFVVGEYYTGVCTGVHVVQKGEKWAMQYAFDIGPEFGNFTYQFLGSDKVGKDGLTNDQRAKSDLELFGLDRKRLDNDEKPMVYIREQMIGQEIEFLAEVYRSVIQFAGCRPPGMQRGPRIVETDNPFGAGPAAQTGGVKF